MSIYTEEEAKTKACYRTLFADTWRAADGTEGSAKTAWTHCIGAACMAWRWQYCFVHVETGEGVHHSPPRGYCGKAGAALAAATGAKVTA